MHFIVFTFILISVAVSMGMLLFHFAYLYKNIKEEDWSWVGIITIFSFIWMFCLYESIDLMYNFINA